MIKFLLPLLLALLVAPLSVTAAESEPKKAPAKTAAAEKTPSPEAVAMAKTLTPAQKSKLMELVNQGDDKALQSLPGIGPARAKAIIQARPFEQPTDLVKVNGIGDATLADIIAHAKAGFPQPEKGKGADKPKKAAAKQMPADKKGAKE